MKYMILCDDSNLEEVSNKAKKKSFGIEIQGFYKPKECENEEHIDLSKQKIEGIHRISLHAPFGDLCPGSSDPMVRDVARNRFELAYGVANTLGANSIVYHIGWIPGAGMVNRRSERCIEFWKSFLEGKSEQVNFYIENQFDHDPEVLSLVIEGINKPNVKICLDIGHAHCHSKTSVIDWVKILGDKIGYVHIHDNNGLEDEHLGIGKGNIPMSDVLLSLNEYAPDAIWALECKVEDMDESISWLTTKNLL